MSLGYGVVQLDVTIVNTALNSIGSALGGGVSELQWVVSTYTIAFAALILTAGALGDRLGAKNIFMAGFSRLHGGVAGLRIWRRRAAILIAARAVQGVGAAILVPNSLALLNHAYPDDKERGRAVGNVGGRREPGAHGGAVRRRRADRTGGLAQHLSGQSADRARRPVADLALCDRHGARRSASSICRGRRRRLPRSACWRPRSSRAAVSAGAMSGCWRAFAAFVVFAALFVVQERRAHAPMLPLSLFAHRMFALTSLDRAPGQYRASTD